MKFSRRGRALYIQPEIVSMTLSPYAGLAAPCFTPATAYIYPPAPLDDTVPLGCQKNNGSGARLQCCLRGIWLAAFNLRNQIDLEDPHQGARPRTVCEVLRLPKATQSLLEHPTGIKDAVL